MDEYKGHTCFHCGGSFDTVQLDLEHVDPATKVASISSMVRTASMAALIAELAKTIPLCANCHRLATTYGVG